MRAGGARFLARRVRGARVTLVRERGGRDMHRKSAASARKVWFRGNEGGGKGCGCWSNFAKTAD